MIKSALLHCTAVSRNALQQQGRIVMHRQLSKETDSASATTKTSHQALTDSFGRFHNYLRISLTEKCNLRCVYCMPLEGVQLTPKEKVLTLDERKRLISIFASLGVNKLRFTGGEPTVSKELVPLIEHARSIKEMKSIGITSNGIVLKDKLDKLVTAGMSSVNVSLDTMIAEKFASITRRGEKNFMRVLSAIYASAGKDIPVKVNCVIIRGVNDHEIADFVALTREAPIDVRFIELMPFDGNSWSKEKFVSYHEIIDRLRVEHNVPLERIAKIRPSIKTFEDSSATTASTGTGEEGQRPAHWQFDAHDTTKWYSAGTDTHLGRVGFITSMSNNFCGGCNRLRLTADGHLKVCLFGDEALSLRDAMREGLTDEEIVERIGAAVLGKKRALGGHATPSEIASSSNRPMILIGG